MFGFFDGIRSGLQRSLLLIMIFFQKSQTQKQQLFGGFFRFSNTDFSLKKTEKNTPNLERTSPRSGRGEALAGEAFLAGRRGEASGKGQVASSTGFFGRDLIQQIWVLRDFLILQKNEGLVFFFAS